MNNRHKIAIIEDEPAINEMYRMKLDLEGFDVITAFNGEEGLALVKKHKPDLILLDIKMPVMSGDEMLEKLRSTEWGAKMRVVILTNISRDEAPHNLRLLHVDRYIVKAQIVTLVREIIG